VRGKLVGSVVVGLALGLPTSASALVRHFHSPNRNISCEVTTGFALGTRVHCQSLRRPLSASLVPTGEVQVCSGTQCLGRTFRRSVPLRYGAAIRVGPFRCFSQRSGIRCIVLSTGHGFKINHNTVLRF